MIRPSIDSRKTRLATTTEVQRLRVELKELRAQIDALRGQYNNHTHHVFENSMFGGECVTYETGQPK